MKFLIIVIIIRALIAYFSRRENAAPDVEETYTGDALHPAEYELREPVEYRILNIESNVEIEY